MSSRNLHASGSGSASTSNYDELVELVRKGFHWDNLIRFCSILSEDSPGQQRSVQDAFEAIQDGMLSRDSQVCLSSLMYSDNITENFKGTPTVAILLKRFATPSFSSAILKALEQHIGDQSIVKQTCKCLVEWAQIAAAQDQHSAEWITISNQFMHLLDRAQECGANYLESQSGTNLANVDTQALTPERPMATSGGHQHRHGAQSSSSNANAAQDADYEEQLARALELSTKENYRQTSYHDDDQTIKAVLELSKIELEMQGVQQEKMNIQAASASVSKERDEGLRAIDDLTRDLEGVLKQLAESQKELESKSETLSQQMSAVDIVNGSNAWEKIADLSKAHSQVDSELRRVKHQRELVQYAASELKSVDDFIMNEDLGKEQARQIHESIVGELMERIVTGDLGAEGGKGIPVTVVQELKQRFGDEDLVEQQHSKGEPKSIGRKISSSISKFFVRGQNQQNQKNKKEGGVQASRQSEHSQKSPAGRLRVDSKLKQKQQLIARQMQSPPEVASQQQRESPSTESEAEAGAAKPKEKKTKSEMMSALNDIKKLSKQVQKPSKLPSEAAGSSKHAAKGRPPPPPPPPGAGAGRAPPPPPPPGGSAPPPPPPPGGMSLQRSASSDLKRAPQVVALYQDLRKALIGPTVTQGGTKGKVKGGSSGGRDSSQMFAEMAGKSSYVNNIKADVDYYGEFINDLIKEVNKLKAVDMDGLSSFVNRIDHALAILTDERAVLKNFNWPEAKYDTMREATASHMELLNIKSNCVNWQCGSEPSEVECSKLSAYFDKVQQKIERYVISQEKSSAKYKEHKVPWDMQIVSKTKISTLNLLKLYLTRIMQDVQKLEQQGTHNSVLRINSLLVSAVRFAFRVHQFVRGFNPECISLFEHISNTLKKYPGSSSGAK